MIKIILWLWQFPQNVIGLIWKLLQKSNIISTVETQDSKEVGATVYLMRTDGGVTLGKYIFVSQNYKDKEKTIKHECGHCRQSKILGPLYLLVIGLPSILHAAFNQSIGCCWQKGKWNYYHFYTEHILMGKYEVNGY